MKEYVIMEYTDKDSHKKEFRIVDEDDLWIELDRAKGNSDVKIVVYLLGTCILDWS